MSVVPQQIAEHQIQPGAEGEPARRQTAPQDVRNARTLPASYSALTACCHDTVTTKADDRRTIKSADFVGRFYRTTKSANFCMSHDRFYCPILWADIVGDKFNSRTWF